MRRTEISRADLQQMVILEIRKHPEFDHVLSLGFMRPIDPEAEGVDRANWAPAWLCDSPGRAPAVAAEIAQGFQKQCDLIW